MVVWTVASYQSMPMLSIIFKIYITFVGLADILIKQNYNMTCSNVYICYFGTYTFPALPQVGKLVVACRWSTVYSTEP